MKWVYDKEEGEVVTSEEYEKRKAERKSPHSFEMPYKPERGVWKLDKATGKLVPLQEKKKVVEAPAIQTDDIPPTESYATAEGKVFTSKKKLLEHYKANGCTVKEPGMCTTTPKPYKADPKEIRETAAKLLNDLRWGNIPLTEKEKEQCRQEERKFQEYKKRMH